MKHSNLKYWAISALFILCVSCTSLSDQPSDKIPEKDSVTVTMTSELLDSLTPSEIQEKFEEGNRRFVSGKMLHRDYQKQVGLTGGGQHPYAIVVSCIDSRNPAEFIFDAGIGDIFNARVAGNFVNTDILGSIEYACKVSGAKMILVMGHSGCGAIKSACDHVQLGNITEMLANIKPAIDSVKGFENDRSSKNDDFVRAVSKENVLLTQRKILENSPIIRELVDKNQVKMVGCMYDVKKGTVEFYQ
jgi:carbonic anhydrase